MSDVLEVRGETLGAAIKLDDGRGLALDRQVPGEYVGWAVYESADFSSDPGPSRQEDVTVSRAIEFAPDARSLIVTATMYAIAHHDAWIRLKASDMTPVYAYESLEESDKLITELVEAGVAHDVVVALARGL
jgi:hypothetical protein